ncbi:MAG TPA: branched-chain amino acid ABC transporter substrate-binding protein, partial [Acidimicrobiia bacterium]|nr:branched-chain amino acid ABC transporter substrate-binding protein [Acidimicrobiia bacterium]
FRVTGRDDQQAAFAARFLAGPGGVKRLALLHDNSVYAKGLAELIRSANDELKLGMQVVFFDAITPDQADYRSALMQVRASGADTLYFTGYPPEAGVILRQAKELGLPTRLVGGDGTNDPGVIKAAGAAAEGFVVTTAPLPQFLPSGEAFAQSYRQRFGRAPGPYTMYQYDMVRVLANAIFWAGSTDPKDIVEALRTTRHQGLTGEIFFDEKGDRQTAVHVTAIVRDGEFRPHKKLDARDNWVDG